MAQNRNIPRPSRDIFPQDERGERLYKYMLELIDSIGTDVETVLEVIAKEPIVPVSATDTGTDVYETDEDITLADSPRIILRDFQSANTTTTPTLDGRSIVSKDGSAISIGDILGVHWLQWNGTNFLLLNKAS